MLRLARRRLIVGTVKRHFLGRSKVARRILRPYRIPIALARADAEIDKCAGLVGRCQQHLGKRVRTP